MNVAEEIKNALDQVDGVTGLLEKILKEIDGAADKPEVETKNEKSTPSNGRRGKKAGKKRKATRKKKETTVEQVKVPLQQIMEEFGEEGIKEVMEPFGVELLRNLEPEHYDDLIKAAEEYLAADDEGTE